MFHLKRKKEDPDIEGSPVTKIQCRGIAHYADSCKKVLGDAGVKKNKADDDGQKPGKKMRCSSTSGGDASVNSSRSGSADSVITVSCKSESAFEESMVDLSSDEDDGLNFISEEERIFELSSVAKTSKTDFEDRYREIGPLGAGGYGSVFKGIRKSDRLPVAIKYIPTNNIKWQKVTCNGKVYKIILEVALMLKAAGLPGSVGQSIAVSLLDWYILDRELILVIERPCFSMDLFRYLYSRREPPNGKEAKMILRQLVDAALDLESKGIFHRDIKLQNVVVQLNYDVPRVRIIDFGCGSFSSDRTYRHFCGTPAFIPPEWYDIQGYWAGPTTVWQLGAIFFSLLGAAKSFTTLDFIQNKIQINRVLPKDVKTLLDMCLVRDPIKRATLEELQRHPALQKLSPPST